MGTTTSDVADTGETQEWLATLVRGRVYITPTHTFEAGAAPVCIDNETKVYLEKNAVDLVSVENEGEFQTRPKFEFVPAPKKAPDQRTRSR
jgi:hypothetical protein